jgi:serine/threonine-protein kinase SRPK3
LLVEKYKFSENNAREFAKFLCTIFDFAPEKRPTAQQCLQHPWLNLRNSTQDQMKNEVNMGKLNVGIGNLMIKVGM